MRRIKASEIVRDMTFYPRCAVDPEHVAAMVQFLDAGGKLPPVVICRKTRALVDGFHRLQAHIDHYGDDCDVSALERDYRRPRDMWLDAVRYNAQHGLPLRRSDREHCRLICVRLGIDAGDFAEALGVRPAVIGPLVAAPPAKCVITTEPTLARRNPSEEFAGRRKRSRAYIASVPSPDDGADTGPRVVHNAVDVNLSTWSAKRVIAAAVAWRTAFQDDDKLDQKIKTEALEEAVDDYLEQASG